jgi:translation initiation factor IF-2
MHWLLMYIHLIQVPIIVAINKCDKHDVNPHKIKEQLLQYNINVEEMGGDVPCVHVSGLTGLGLDALEETIIAIAEVSEYKGDPSGLCEGTIIESNLTRERGHVATILVNRGTLKLGAVIVSGTSWAKVRHLTDTTGSRVKKAGPSDPVEVLGWKTLPSAGDMVISSNKGPRSKV